MPYEFPSLNDREVEAYEKLRETLSPRPEYAEGKEKLHFEHQFSTGEVLYAFEDQRGIAEIIIKKGDEVVMDFKDLLPAQVYRFVTPSYFKDTFQRPDLQTGDWGTIERIHAISVGDMRNAKSIFFLLHEIGHVRNRELKGHRDPGEEWENVNGLFKKDEGEDRRKIIKEISDVERGATAEALKITRHTKEAKNINLLEGFESSDELRDFIYAALLTYRISHGNEMIRSDNGLLKEIWEAIQKKLFDKQESSEQWEFLETLFDKGRLKR
jgi:hypothetical protein